MQRTTPLGVLMIVSAILLPTFALVCIALVDRFECGGDETVTPPPPGSQMAAYCDGSAGWASLLCLPVLLAGWFLGRRLRSR